MSRRTGVTFNKYFLEKNTLHSSCLLENKYSPSTYLLVNKYSLQEISTPIAVAFSVTFLHQDTARISILLGNIYILIKSFYRDNLKQLLKGVPLNGCS